MKVLSSSSDCAYSFKPALYYRSFFVWFSVSQLRFYCPVIKLITG